MDPSQGHEFLPAWEGHPVWQRTEALQAAVERGQAGQDFKSNLEDLLKSLVPDQAEELLMLGQEGRGAFALMLVPASGSLLFVGDSLSGTITALAKVGFELTVCDHDPARLEFARQRDAAWSPGQVHHVQVAPGGPFPFAPKSFEVVVAELGPAGEAPLWGAHASILHGLARDSFVWVTDNALGYKRALGRRGKFAYQTPWSMLRRLLHPSPGEGTRAAQRRELAGSFGTSACLALYPHRLESSHVVHLDQALPRLTVGPKERRNRLKLLANKVGAFPWLAPSFAWIARREPRPTAPRLQRILDELSERLQAPRLLPEHLIASRGNVAVVQTTRTQGHGGWTLHVPLCRHKSRLVVRHFDWLQRLRTEHPNVPVPEPLYAGTCQGLYLSVEERLPGHHAPQLSDGSLAQQRMLRDVARSLPQLAHGPRRILDADELERLLGDRIRRVLRLCGRSDTARRIQRMWDQAHEALLGHTYQPVVYHADLRPKHVQVDHEGSLQGFMDWGACEAHFLPYVDLLHLVAHRRSESARLQWERWQTGGLEAWEAEVLAEYRQTMQLDPQVAQALESLYPVLVAGMAERNWEFSRPYWVHKVFGL